MKRIAVAFLLLLPCAAWAVPAQEGNWQRGCQAGSVAKNLEGGSWVCYSPISASLEAASPILDVADCENVDIFLWDDFDGDGANVCTVTWDIETCPPGASALATDALKNAACTTLPGIVALAGDDVESNLAALTIRVHGLAAGANATGCRIVVKCAEGAQ